MKRLTLAELTDLTWTTIEGLGSTSPFRVQAAASMLLTVVQEHGAQLETVRGRGTHGGPTEMGQGRRGGPALSTQELGPLGQGGGPERERDQGDTDPTLTGSNERGKGRRKEEREGGREGPSWGAGPWVVSARSRGKGALTEQ